MRRKKKNEPTSPEPTGKKESKGGEVKPPHTKVNLGYVINDVTIDVQPAYKSSMADMLYVDGPGLGAVLDDKLIVATVTLVPYCPAAKYGYITPEFNGAKLDVWIKEKKVPKYKLWLGLTSNPVYTFREIDMDHIIVTLSRVKSDATPLVSRLDHAFSQTLLAGLDDGNERMCRFRYNVIRGVELGLISSQELTEVFKSLDKEEIALWKKALDCKRMSINTLYKDIRTR